MAVLMTAAYFCGCANVHTLESTQHMSGEQLTSLCADLRLRANQDCRWNMEARQSSVPDQQSWEINCRARRDYARESYDNVCHTARLDPERRLDMK